MPPSTPAALSARARAVMRAKAAAARMPGRFCPDRDAVPSASGYRMTLALPFGLLAAAFGAVGVGGDDRAAQRGPELADGLLACSGQDLVFDGAGFGVVEGRGGFGDGLGAGQVDDTLAERLAGGGQPPLQVDGEVGPPFGAGLGHGQGQGHLAIRIGRDPAGAAILTDAPVFVGGGGP